VVCLEHDVQVSVCGCEVSLSLCLYLQMHTFQRIGSLWLLQCNCCWHHHGDKSLQSAAWIEFDESRGHYRYVCTLWRPWIYIVFYNYGLWCPYRKSITDHKCPPQDHIVSRHNSSHIFTNFFLVLYCIAYCSQIHPIIIIIIIIPISNDMPVTVVFPFSHYSIFYYWASSIPFPMQNLIQNSCIVIHCYHFQHLPIFLWLKLCLYVPL